MRILTQIREITDIVKASNISKLITEEDNDLLTYGLQQHSLVEHTYDIQPLTDYLEKLPQPVLEHLVSLFCIARERVKIINAKDFKNYHEDLMTGGRFRRKPGECARYLRDRALNLEQYLKWSKKYTIYTNT